MGFNLDGYVDVAERIALFRAAHPDGSLQPADLSTPYRIETIGERTFIVYVAAAYRSPDDTRPGIGAAWEPFPGQTNYTRDSELQNAETAAWGRAIVAVGAADTKRGVASRQEVAYRQPDAAPAGVDRSTGEITTTRRRPSPARAPALAPGQSAAASLVDRVNRLADNVARARAMRELGALGNVGDLAGVGEAEAIVARYELAGATNGNGSAA